MGILENHSCASCLNNRQGLTPCVGRMRCTNQLSPFAGESARLMMTCHNCQTECKKFGNDRKGTQRYRCRQCAKTFSEERQSLLGRMRLADEKAIPCLQLLVEGTSIRSIERITGVHRDTVMKLLVEAGRQCQALRDRSLSGVKPTRLEFDEIWDLCEEKAEANPAQRNPNGNWGSVCVRSD